MATTLSLNPSEYSHSQVHHLILLNNGPQLSALLSSLPPLCHPSSILSISDSIRESSLSSAVSALLDRRDVPENDTPLHLTVRLNRPQFAAQLLLAGADPSLQNAAGWSPLHLAISLNRPQLSKLLLKHYRLNAWAKLRRRLHLILPALRQMQDSYLEISFKLESPIVPFLSKAAPSDTCRIWKRGADVRADVSLAGFDGLRTKRADRSFLFLAAPEDPRLPLGSLLVLHHGRREVRDVFSGIEDTESDDDLISDSTACRPGLNISSAELVPRVSWRGKEKTELVANTWKARSYDLNNILFTFKTLQSESDINGDGGNANNGDCDSSCGDVILEEEDVMMPLRIREDDGDFLVADIVPPRRSCYEPRRRSVDSPAVQRRKSVDVPAVQLPRIKEERNRWERKVKCKEKETVKSLRPTVWLTEDFPLKLEEILPLLDILSNGVRAVRRLRELLTTKFPPGTFPVKVAIPVVPTIRVVVTFMKFVALQPEQFFTPLSSPSFIERKEEKEELKKKGAMNKASSWLRWATSNNNNNNNNNNNAQNKSTLVRSKSVRPESMIGMTDTIDPFLIPMNYSWVNVGLKNQERKKSSVKKGKLRE